MMDAVSATIFDGGEQLVENTSSSRIKLIKRLLYRFILNQAKALFTNPFWSGCPRPIGRIHS